MLVELKIDKVDSQNGNCGSNIPISESQRVLQACKNHWRAEEIKINWNSEIRRCKRCRYTKFRKMYSNFDRGRQCKELGDGRIISYWKRPLWSVSIKGKAFEC